MTIAILYLVLAGIEIYATNGNCHINTTHILMASGIIGICGGLDGIKKEIGRDKRV